MESLYDSLHLPNPDRPEAPVTPWPDTLTGHDFARLVVNSMEFRQYILMGLRSGELGQGVVKQIMDYAWGQPASHVVVDDGPSLESMSKSELEAHIAVLTALVESLPDESASSVH